MDKYYLMYKDTPVISFGNHFEELTILDTAYLPYGLRNRRIETAISSWLADRATPITRDNAEFLYMVLGKSRSPSAQRSTMLEFGGVSVNDFFWIKRAEESVTWQRFRHLQDHLSGLRTTEHLDTVCCLAPRLMP